MPSTTSLIMATPTCIVLLIVSISLEHTQAQNTELMYSIQEELPAMTHVGNVLEDSNIRELVSIDDIADLRFSFLTQGNPLTSYLWINSTSGELKTSSRINRESLCPKLTVCELKVQTVVQAQIGAFFKIIQVKITVIDINDNAPSFTTSTYATKISEGEIPGVSFQLPTATDPDMGLGNSVVGYNLVASSAPFSLAVDGSASSFNVRLRLDAGLDRESTDFYKLFVLAVDGGNPKLTGTLTVNIEVTDVNDHSPVFQNSEYLANISDSTAVDSVVAVVKATDADDKENGVVHYAMAATQEDPVVFAMFYVNGSTGEVKNKVSLDSYAGRSYRVTIEARDSGVTQRTTKADVLITVLDTHNSQPEILLNVFGQDGIAKVSELAELGRVVAHVAVSDPDSSHSPNGQILCYLNSTNLFQLQAMDVKQFKVILTKRLDREQQTFHSVTVICEDSGSPSLNASSNFIVEVEDENDNPPIFDSFYYSADVIEGPIRDRKSRSNVALTVQASDKDIGVNSQITYRFAEGSDPDFGIYTDGSIVVTNPAGVDREDKIKGAVRRLTVLAVDGGKLPLTGTTTVVITIRDINDNPPKFSEPMYFFSVPENAPLDYIVNNVSASDLDLEGNAIFYFEMHKRDVDTVPFHVTRNGVIKVSGSVDRETKASYEFRVVAYDLGEPVRMSSTVTVHIRTTDVNDNSPQFIFPSDDNYTIFVPHTLGENTAFASILAVDRDEGRNSELIYARDSGNGSKFFDVEASSGQVVLVRPLTIKDVGLHIIVVVAYDRGVDIQMTAQSVMHIIVYEGNATLPLANAGIGFRNIVVVVVLVVVTVVLALAILLTILLIRRVDKQRRLYHAKNTEVKIDSNFRHLNVCPIADLESPAPLSDMPDDTKEGGRKKKEVSFSLDEDNNVNSPQIMTTFSPLASDKYDAICDKDRGKMKNDQLTSNHYQTDRHVKISGGKKDVTNFNYHLVHPLGTNGPKDKQAHDSPHQHDDNRSDVSGDSTSDSGRGGSDVELQSHGGVSKESGDTSFASQRDTHNNLSAINKGSNSIAAGSNMKYPTKSVHFQNIRPDPSGYGSLVSLSTPSTFASRPPRSPVIPAVQVQKNCPGASRFAPNVLSEGHDSFVKVPSNINSHTFAPTGNDLELHRNRMFSDGAAGKQNNRHVNTRCPNNSEYSSDVSRVRSSISQRSNSNSCLDGTDTWDGDTTTSGSYTVDPQELCDEIDKLFFDEFQDVVV